MPQRRAFRGNGIVIAGHILLIHPYGRDSCCLVSRNASFDISGSIVSSASLFGSRSDFTSKGRRQLLQFGALLLLLVCFCSPIVETFDYWDHTLQTGNDVEYSLVVVALVAGAVFGMAHAATILVCTVSLMHYSLSPFVSFFPCSPPPTASTGYSPPQPLRI